MSLPSSSSGEYGFTDDIVGTLSFTKIVGRISKAPPIANATNDNMDR